MIVIFTIIAFALIQFNMLAPFFFLQIQGGTLHKKIIMISWTALLRLRMEGLLMWMKPWRGSSHAKMGDHGRRQKAGQYN